MRSRPSHPLRRIAVLIVGLVGCSGDSPSTTPDTVAGSGSSTERRVHFVGFDVSDPLLNALQTGKLEGTILQNPLRMGELGVKSVVAALEKQPVEPKISTGETLVTPENLTAPEIAGMLKPPKVDHQVNAAISGAKTKKWRIMVIPKGTTHEHWKTIHAGAIKAAEELGNVELIWQGPQKEDDRNQQIQLVQNAVAAGVDGLVLAPLDAKALVEPVEQAIDRGIPVVIIDSALQSDRIASYVATDNYHGGVLAAQRLGTLLNGSGKIIMLRYMVGSASTQEREQGFLDTIAKEFPGITFLEKEQYGGATADTAQRASQNLITRYGPQVDGIFCPNESSTLGMLRVLEGSGLLGGAP